MASENEGPGEMLLARGKPVASAPLIGGGPGIDAAKRELTAEAPAQFRL